MYLSILTSAIPLASAVLKTVNAVSELEISNKNIEEINVEVDKQDAVLQLAQQQARVAQELAIAIRIETADEVEIEEFYDTSKDGRIGAVGNSNGIDIGISGSAKSITKRVYKFKGQNEKKAEIYEQKLNEIFGANKSPD